MAAKRRCVIISASPDCDVGYMRSCIRDGDYIVCADGGVDHLAKTDIIPDLIVGDFDSAKDGSAFPGVETISLKVRKIDTDTMHCVDVALDRGFTEFLFLGATGGRTDHLLANLAILIYLSKKGAHGVISDSVNDIMLLENGLNTFHTEVGATVSVIPFGETSAEVSYTGMSYPLEHGAVNVDYPYTISNESVSDVITVELHKGRALIIFVHKK